MENIIFERDYSQKRPQNDNREWAISVFERAMYGSFAREYQEAMDAIPKVVVPEYKANYEYLLQVCDGLAQRWGGSVRGEVNYQRWDATIDLNLRFAEFSDPKDLQLLRDMAEKSHSVTFQTAEGGGINIHIFNLYFEELASDVHRGFVEYGAIMNDPKLAEMLGIPTEPSPEIEATADFFNGLLDKVEEATGQDRTAIFKELLHRVSEKDDLDHVIEHLEQAAEDMVNEGGSVSPPL